MAMRSILIEPHFFSDAKKLRQHFDSRFQNPRDTKSERFVWDYWHIEDQYTLIRTPARYFFPKPLFQKLESALLDYGANVLGCHGISDPWISYYIDGCGQNLHADNPHGPWAFVFSLTNWDRRQFTGGETQVARPQLLDYWTRFSSEVGTEYRDLIEEIPAKFNQLLVFDPRIPHGVKRVAGVRDPREARIAIHGWFTEPRPFVKGALSKNTSLLKKTEKELNDALEWIGEPLSELGRLHGTVSVRYQISPSGSVVKSTLLTNTLLDLEYAGVRSPRVRDALSLVMSGMKTIRFPKARGASEIIVPFLFRS